MLAIIKKANAPSILNGCAVALLGVLLHGCGSPQPTSSSATVSVSSTTVTSSSKASSSSSVASPIQLPLVVAVNAGGQATTTGGVAYIADKYFSGGTAGSTTDPIAGTTDDSLYQSERYGDYSYQVPVTAGTYTIKLHFAEIYHTSAGMRSFNVAIEGSTKMSNVDLYSLVGTDGAYEYEVKDVPVSDGQLTITLQKVTDNATLAGFAVYSANGKLDTSTPQPDPTGIPNTGPERSMGYLGCSMSVNLAEGYQALGGKRLWPPIGAYNGQVVQSWANNNHSVWNSFNSAITQYGKPTAVWVMLCIFDNQVTIEEARTIVANVRSRVPDAAIYITGQPVYNDPNSCFLAGDGGPDKTDRIAQQAGNEAGLNVIYPGKLGPLASNQSTDGCHTNTAGSALIGQQFIDWFGK